MLHFLEIKSQFESSVSDNELLELCYVPYAFGGGLVAYRIKGKIVKLNFDGKDEWITIYMTPKNSFAHLLLYNHTSQLTCQFHLHLLQMLVG